ncbi:MAG: ATP-dependent helicase, partial [Spirochaetota bacterium]
LHKKNTNTECRYNSDQQKIIHTTDGPHLVLAGAGTGKTFTIVERVTYLIKTERYLPEQILLLTFSKKAAGELRERVTAHCPSKSKSITASTFHSFALSLLQRYGGVNNTKSSFSVMDDLKSRDVLCMLAGSMRSSFSGIPVPVILWLYSQYNMNRDSIIKRMIEKNIMGAIEVLNSRYKDYKREQGLVDFSDMMHKATMLLSEDNAICRDVQNRYKYIVVDEFQDTSDLNFSLLSHLVEVKKPGLMVVGDDWQSIYGFRNARIEYILNMKKYFPGVKVLRLTQNYRSRKEILTFAHRIIKKNRFRSKKKVISVKGKGGSVEGLRVRSFDEELHVVAGIIDELRSQGVKTAVLYRNNWQGEKIRLAIKEKPGEGKDLIHLMTIHSSKGLEFHTVILTGLRDGTFPDPATDIEEERRLFYVACTRAEERLIVLYHVTGDDEPAQFAREAGF